MKGKSRDDIVFIFMNFVYETERIFIYYKCVRQRGWGVTGRDAGIFILGNIWILMEQPKKYNVSFLIGQMEYIYRMWIFKDRMVDDLEHLCSED